MHSKHQRVQHKIDMVERLSKNDVRDGRTVMKEMDISLISAQSYEKLLKYIGLREG